MIATTKYRRIDKNQRRAGTSGTLASSQKDALTMQVPLQVAFEGIQHSDAIEARIREEAHKLEQFLKCCRTM
jgi:hypothetical protein